MFTLNCKGKLLVIDRPMVMGIINITPDSFYAGSRLQVMDEILKQAEKMIKEGASFLDIGAQSSRPGSELLSADQELSRIGHAIAEIHRLFPETVISVDTFHSKVAKETVAAGASLINDISAGFIDPLMLQVVASLHVPYVCMHMKGTPQNMQQDIFYENIVTDVVDFFIERIASCKKAGIHDIIIDPGFGFGKTIAHNFQLLKKLEIFKMLDKPILAGLSRKSTIYKTLGVSADDALNGSTVLHTLALQNGANILRVHDVKEAMEAITLFERYTLA